MAEIVLKGLDGSNPLAFLAALGVLVALDDAAEDAGHARPTLRWQEGAAWRPVVHSVVEDLAGLVEVLDADRLARAGDPALAFTYSKSGKVQHDVKPPPEELHRQLLTWIDEGLSARSLAWFTAFVSEGARDGSGASKPSALHFTAGQQRFLSYGLELAAGTSADHLCEVLVGPWSYASRLPVFGWDNTETRDYALRARDPSKLKLGNPGADWLALRGLRLLPTAARNGGQTTALAYGGWKRGYLQWPMWTPPLSLPLVASLLVRPLPATSLQPRLGVGAVFRCQVRRSDQGGYGSVSPASVV